MTAAMHTPYNGAALENDTRGWIMSGVSGVACVVGAGVVYADVFVAKICRYKSFKLAENQTFLASSLSLSSGVLIFTSLYSMLPTARDYFTRAGYSITAATYMVIGLFLLGVVVIRIVSTIIHSHLPSSVVECEPGHKLGQDDDVERGGGHNDHDDEAPRREWRTGRQPGQGATERSPLLRRPSPDDEPPADFLVEPTPGIEPQSRTGPSVGARLSQQIRAVALQTKVSCDETGQCLGFTHPCRHDCVGCSKLRSTTTDAAPADSAIDQPHDSQGQPVELPGPAPSSSSAPTDATSGPGLLYHADGAAPPSTLSVAQNPDTVREDVDTVPSSGETTAATSPTSVESHPQHHHHVPRDKFMSLGLQTSLAIALHKLPEGFITFATNHANPTLGWSVFLALFIHNITEGFAMCLPLYLALRSRLKAMVWSSFLGGISQPAGAAIAALWIWGARKGIPHSGDGVSGSDDISWAVYGGLFAGTAGVMTNVALQLYSEALQLSHNHAVCIGFSIAGMGVLGLSFALTAE